MNRYVAYVGTNDTPDKISLISPKLTSLEDLMKILMENIFLFILYIVIMQGFAFSHIGIMYYKEYNQKRSKTKQLEICYAIKAQTLCFGNKYPSTCSGFLI